MASLLSPFLDIIFPPRCPFCDTVCREPACLSCADAIRFISAPLCNICGIPFASDAIKNHTCGECIKNKRHFSWARGILAYNDTAGRAIHRFKYKKDTTFSKALGKIISDYPILEGFDVIIPVPLHIKRLRERGFNQSLLLARAVGKRHRIPVNPFALKRTRWTELQVNLSGDERRINVKGAFEVHGGIEGKRVLLIDDVYTTGATVGECSKVIKKYGAKEVCVLTLARTA